jgi:hypothetical protein
MTRKKDDGFTSRALMALAAALADCNYNDAEIIVAAMAKEYGVELSPQPSDASG